VKKLFSTAYSHASFSIATLLLRVILGGLMIPHGFNKIVHFANNSQTFSDPFHMGHTASLLLTIFAEFFCSILIVLGFLTRLACIPLIITMAVVVFYVHHGQVFEIAQTAALFLTGFIALLFIGPGRLSMDRLIGK
jgi:putative oxidoreductase